MCGGSCGGAGSDAQAALEALLLDGSGLFDDDPESALAELESLAAAPDPLDDKPCPDDESELDDESDLDRSDARARALAP
ncbi:MAG: hypothetical protein OXB92_03675 [Acidimicrobiaceae bacterium]|nr:hypothetical protein [Acidimicrobiaceae bacterium]